MQTIKSTVASDTNDLEFDLFMEACRSYRLDPFRKQIHAVVYSKDNPSKRKMSIIVARDGLRIIAQRCKDYRPASEPATIEYDKALVGPTNPKGIVRAIVKLFKQDNRGEWYPVAGEAYWDEFAPLKDQWAYDEEARKDKPTGKKTLDASGNWAKSPTLMISKCAESQALRAGWPDEFGGIYSEEEMDRLAAESSASEALREYERSEREARIGGRGVMMVFDSTMKLEKVPMGSVADRCVEFLDKATPEEAHIFRVRNEDPLREFWSHSPADALALKRLFEAKEAKLIGSAA
jgi:phage recombination protein Bet